MFGCVKLVSFLCTFFMLGVCVRSYGPFAGYYNSLFRPLNADFKTKVETLGAMLKRHVQRLRATENKQIELVFLVDSSSSVGSEHFFDELRFVRKLLADFTVDVNTTRVSVITFSSRGKVIRYVDHISHPSEDKHKCGLLHEELPRVRYIGGGTYTLGAFLEAKEVLRSARPEATKAIFLITDGFSNGGDPRPEARSLRKNGVTIFTFGIRNGNFRELYDMASDPKNETCYILESFEEFEALARRALHEDLHSGIYMMQKNDRCNSLCEDGNCCHPRATCACGTHTGKYECLCGPGYYGHGMGDKGCKSCPAGTYKDFTGPGNIEVCMPCPDANQVSEPGATSPRFCTCKKGYGPQNSSDCSVFTCAVLEAPKNGYFVNNKCNNVFNAACGLRCRPGYELHGSSVRICQEDGTWSGLDSDCIMKTCPPLPTPKNGHMICNHDDFAYSTVCRFTCNTGYKLVGSRKRTCLAIAFWTGITTRCREITCQPLGRLQDGSIHPVVCTAGEVPFGTTCQMSCHPGYTLYGAHTKQCTPDGNWAPAQGKSNQCSDESPPFLQCPKDILVSADEEDSETEVTWQVPVSVDNSALLPTLTTIPAISPPAKFPIGRTSVIYISEDFSKNKAKCKFYVRVVDQTVPRIDRCASPPPVVSHDQYARVEWENPLFSDNSDDELQIKSSHQPGLFPQGTTDVTYTAYDTSGNNNTCTLEIRVIPHPCVIPPPPVNGNRTCFDRVDSVVCTLSCLPDYDFAIPPAPEYTCKSGNIWKPEEKMPFPDCSVRNISNHLVQPATLTFTGKLSCRERKLLKKIDKSFEKKVSDRVSDLCEENVICGVEQIESSCEENNDFNRVPLVLDRRRRRRSVYRQITSKKLKKTLKATHLKYNFNLQAKVSQTGDLKEDNRRQQLMMENVEQILRTLQNETKMGTFNLNFGGLIVEFADVSFDPENPRFVCEEGSVLKDSICVQCPFGTHFNVMTKQCQSCPLGTYQPTEGALACLWCPENRSTENINTKQVNKCKAQCLPGSFSDNGIEQCETCEMGFYQEKYAQTQCLPCPQNTTTRKRGSRREEQCKERCPPGYVSKTGLYPCMACPLGMYQSEEAKSACFECPEGAETSHTASTALSDCHGNWDLQSDGIGIKQGLQQVPVNLCFENPCLNGGTCVPKVYAFTCDCAPGFGGFLCQNLVDECKAKPCLNNGSCTNTIDGYHCSCVSGFQGKKCEIDLDECLSNPCQNNAVCIDGPNSFICRCPDGFQGAACDENINECAQNPCRHGGTCIDKVNGFTCTCGEGFTGETCEIEIDECLENPCNNNGTCVDLEDGFRCQCVTGYTGSLCDSEIDECQSNPCQNGAKCEDRLGAYVCHCLSEYRGDNCEKSVDMNYQLDFPASGTTDFAELTIDRPLTSVTVSFWMKTDDTLNYGTPFSYAVDGFDNALTLTDYNGFVFYVNQERKVTDIEANDDIWHHIVVTWSSNRGSWKIYVDGLLNDSGFDLSTGRTIQENGVLVIGQEQDSLGGGFSSSESFVGSLTHLNIWDEELSLSQIDALRTSCTDFHGNIVAWPDILSGLRGDIKESTSTFCRDCPSPAKPSFGNVTFKDTKVGSFASYSCLKGFNVAGRRQIQCLASGQYEEDSPMCLKVECGYPGSIPNGYVEGRRYSFDDRVNFVCYKGYKLVGSRSLYCNEYGEWEGETPRCVEITCTLPLLSENTRIQNPKATYSPGDQVTFTCTAGNRLHTAHNAVMCQADGSWDKSVPTCDLTSCKTPPSIKNGGPVTELDEYPVSSIVDYDCDFGYTFSNSDPNAVGKISCLPTGNWELPLPECEIVICSDPPIIANGQVIGKDRTFLSSIGYTCDEGYLLSGDDIRECYETGSWSGETPECLAVECPQPADIEHGDYTGDDFTYNSAVVYQCDAGYKMIGEARRRCLAGSTWSGKDPICKPVVCGNPSSIENGHVSAPAITFTSVATYTCNEGFTLEGPSEKVCQEDGSWTTVTHSCHPVECKPPKDIKNGTYQSSDGYLYGNVVTYTCNIGYFLNGESDLTCEADGTWSNDAPVCSVKLCPAPEYIRNGHFKVLSIEYNGRVEYSCNEGYELEGHEVRTCQADRTWTGEEPTCVPIRCEAPPAVANGSVDYKDLTLGSIVRYLCDAGFELNGHEIRRCLQNRSWSDEAPTCTHVTCPVLVAPDHGRITTSENIYKITVRYICEEGYILHGDELTTCLETRSWSHSAPKCKPVECDKPTEIISNGRMNGTVFTYGSTISYVCDEGYRLEGSKTRFCQAHGEWDEHIPVCEAVECPRLHILHGFTSSFEREYNAVVSFSCKTGYYLKGSTKRTCLANGQWSGTAPFCKKIVCPPPSYLDGGGIRVSKDGLKATYTCNSGFRLNGTSERTCQVNGTWSHKNPRCEKIKCPDLAFETWPNGVITVSDVTFRSRASYKCNTGYKLKGNNQRTCQIDGSWSGSAPHCEILSCGPPGAFASGVISGDVYTFGSWLKYSCDIGHRLVGDAIRVCQDDGLWNPSTPRCQLIDCPPQQNIQNGRTIQLSNTYLGTLKYTCDAGYVLQGNMSRTCMETGEWSGKAPQCIMKTCPSPNPIENGKIIGDSYGLGRTIEYQCNEGYRLEGSGHRMCLPTLFWSGEHPSCVKIECPVPTAPLHGHVVGVSYKFGDSITYECEEGYELVGEHEVDCEASGEWSFVAPQCDPISCGTPGEVPNASVNLQGGTTFGSTVTIECNLGYTANGDSSLSCQKDGTWTDTMFRCEIVSCSKIDTFNHGTFDGAFNYGDELNFNCNEGYKITGESTVHCGADGTWDFQFPICKIISCPVPETVQHGHVSPSNHTFGSTVTYTCDEGFRLLGESSRTCNADRLWSGQKPICEIVSCPYPEVRIPNGYLLFPLPQYVYNNELVYECREGYNMLGSDRLQCLATGAWSSAVPSCIKIVCPPPELILHGVVAGDDEIIRYSCEVGYDLVGHSKRRCLKTGRWDTAAPRCMPIQCPDPLPVNHGIVHGDDITFGHVIRYSCLEGYELSGTNERTCQADKTWTDSDPVCNRVKCGPPTALENGSVIGESFLFEDTVTFICNAGFELVGSASVKCLSNKSWSALTPTCKQLFCNPPFTIANGRISISNMNNLAVGTEGVYDCDVGYELQGLPSTRCLPDRSWSGTPPECHIISCPPLTFLDNGYVVGNEYIYKSLIRFSCAHGFEIFGEETLECQKDGSWSATPPACLPRLCEYPPFFENGDFQVIGRPEDSQDEVKDFSYGDIITYDCHEGYVTSGSLQSKCDAYGRWSNPPPHCAPVVCGRPQHVENADITGDSYSFKDSVYYVCYQGLELVGNNKLECGANGRWIGDLPECVLLECSEPLVIDHATVIVVTSGFSRIASYNCNPGYTLSGEDRAVCEMGNWTSDINLQCLPVDCGDPPLVVNGFVDFENTTFESVATVSCDLGYELLGPQEISCDQRGSWTGGIQTCKIINCGMPQGSIAFTGSNFNYGGVVQYTCPVGYRLAGEVYTTCLETGEWSNNPPECLHISCGQPPGPAPYSGSVFNYGSQVSYYCEEGFTLVGEKTAVCQEDGTWSGNGTQCEIVSCGPPPANISFIGDNFYYGHTIQYSCPQGYELIGEATVVCESNGRWSSDGRQYCEKVNCGQPPPTAPFKGSDFSYTSIIRYECPRGSNLIGEAELTCLYTGQWSSSAPECQKVDCGQPPNTAPFEGSDYTYGKTVLYSCPEGHDLKGNAELLCQENGLWSGPGPSCRRVDCGSPPGTATFVGLDFSYGGTVTYSCPEGYLLVGQPTIFCQADGTWSDEGPECQSVSCGPVAIPQNAQVIEGDPITGTRYRDTITIICDEGFTVEGYSTISCLASGVWNASLAKCELVIDLQSFCDLAVDVNHSRPISSGYRVGDMTQVQCLVGFEPEGDMTSHCLEGGTWSRPGGSCRRVAHFCAPTVDLPNSRAIPAGYLRGDVHHVQCQPGYKPQGDMTSTCQDGGTWTVPWGYCTRVFCGKPMVRDMVNIMLIGRSYYYGDRVMYMCRPGMTAVQDPPQLTCSADGQWDGEAACAVQCKQPCLNGGICLGLNRCKCPSGYGGPICQTGICILPCLNGGVCEGPYRCKCRPGYEGPRCGRAICSKPCQNGGRCVRPNWCHCYSGFLPPFCETKQLQ